MIVIFQFIILTQLSLIGQLDGENYEKVENTNHNLFQALQSTYRENLVELYSEKFIILPLKTSFRKLLI